MYLTQSLSAAEKFRIEQDCCETLAGGHGGEQRAISGQDPGGREALQQRRTHTSQVEWRRRLEEKLAELTSPPKDSRRSGGHSRRNLQPLRSAGHSPLRQR